jgi:hypothetical protein
MLDQELHIAPGRQFVTRIDHEKIACRESPERPIARVLHADSQELDRQPRKRRSRRRIDCSELRGGRAVRRSARKEASGVSRADLDDAPRSETPHHRVRRGGIEPWKPVLRPARRRRRLVAQRFQRRCVLLDGCKMSDDRGLGRCKYLLQRS